MSERVLVAGATGGVGQLTVAKLLEKDYSVRVLARSAEKARKLFDDRVEVAIGDTRAAEALPAAAQDVAYIICCTGTTAFPSPKWDFAPSAQTDRFQQIVEWGKRYIDRRYRDRQARNSPQQVDVEGVRHLIAAAPGNLQRFVYISSCGVERKDKPPYNLLNAYGVLDAKQQGETAVRQSGLPYTIIRPGRLIDGPFTSYDLNTLLKATTNSKFDVVIGTGDRLNGQTSRIDVATACVECLSAPATENQVFELVNQGARPAEIDWSGLFAQLPAQGILTTVSEIP